VTAQWHEPAYSGTITEEQFQAWIDEVKPGMTHISYVAGPGDFRVHHMKDGEIGEEMKDE
jgi:hypothetical protein